MMIKYRLGFILSVVWLLWWVVSTLFINVAHSAILSKLEGTEDLPSTTILTGKASWYSQEACQYNPDPRCPTASGDSLYDLEASNISFAAMWGVPLGTIVKVTNLENGHYTFAKILDRGPNFVKFSERIIDLSKLTFSQIADPEFGIVRVSVEIL